MFDGEAYAGTLGSVKILDIPSLFALADASLLGNKSGNILLKALRYLALEISG